MNGPNRRIPHYRTGVLALSPICGLIDTACFLALGGVFAELMTGNLLLLATIAGSGIFTAEVLITYFGALIPFCVGALVAGRVASSRSMPHARLMGYPTEFVLICLATALALWWTFNSPGLDFDQTILSGREHSDAALPLTQRVVVVGMLAAAMGIHNAMMRAHGVANVATNLMTLTLTGLFSESKIAGGTSPHWRLRAGSILGFVAGAAAGAFLLSIHIAAPLVAATAIFSLALPSLVAGRAHEPEPAG